MDESSVRNSNKQPFQPLRDYTFIYKSQFLLQILRFLQAKFLPCARRADDENCFFTKISSSWGEHRNHTSGPRWWLSNFNPIFMLHCMPKEYFLHSAGLYFKRTFVAFKTWTQIKPKRFEFKTKEWESFSRPLTTYLLFQDHHCVMQCNTVYFKYSLFTELKCNFHWLDSLHYGVTMTFCIQINKGKKSNIYKLNVPLCEYALIARTHVPSYSKLFFLFTLYCEQLK